MGQNLLNELCQIMLQHGDKSAANHVGKLQSATNSAVWNDRLDHHWNACMKQSDLPVDVKLRAGELMIELRN